MLYCVNNPWTVHDSFIDGHLGSFQVVFVCVLMIMGTTAMDILYNPLVDIHFIYQASIPGRGLWGIGQMKFNFIRSH